MFVLFMMAFGIVAVPAAYILRRRQYDRQERARLNPSGKQKTLREKTQSLRLPYRYGDDDIFISGNSVWTGVKLAGTTDEYLTAEEKADAAAAVAATYNALLAVFDGETVVCHEHIRYRPSSAEEWERQYLKQMWHPTRLFKQLVRQVSGQLAESSPERVRFLLVRLGDFNADSVPDPLSAIATQVTGVADEHFRTADLAPFRERAVRVHLQLASFRATPMTRADLVWLIRKVASGHRFPAEQPILSQKPLRNGYFDMVFNMYGRNGHDYIELLDTDPETGETRSTFTTTLVVSNTAPQTEFNPAYSWGPALARHSRPVELSWRYELVPAADFKKRAIEIAENIKDEARDRLRGRAGHDPFFNSKHDRANDLFEDTGRDPQPALVGRLRLVLSAPTLQELALAEQEVRTTMGDIEMERVPRAQLHLLREQLPGDYAGKVFGGLLAARGGGLTVGERTTDIWAPAIARLDSADRVGDRVELHKGRPRGSRGFPAAWTLGSGAPVHFMLHSQVARDRGAGVGFLGGSGGGKSGAAMMNFFIESESGVQCLVLDPKNDFEKFCYYIAFGEQVLHPAFAREAEAGTLGTDGSVFQPVNRAFWEDTTVINLSRGAAGQLDAWSIRSTYHEAEELARGQIEVLFPDPDDRKIVEQGLVKMREHWEQQQAGTLPADVEPITPCLGAVVQFINQSRTEYLEIWNKQGDVQSKEAVERFDRVLDRFKRAQTTQYTKLMIGTGERVALGDMSRRRVIFTLHGFTPPNSPDPRQWSESESNAAACMFTALTLVQDLFDDSLRPNPVTGQMRVPPRALYVDEAYMIARLPRGQLLLSKGLRQGRSLNLIVVIISQQARDVQELEAQAKEAGEADVNQFGTIFVFRQKSKPEALQALQLLRDTGTTDRDKMSAEMGDLARNLLEEGPAGGLLRTGRCVMRDVDGRVATICFDQWFEELARAMETNATERPNVQNVPISGDGREWMLDPTTMLEVRTGVLEAMEDAAHALRGTEVEFDDDWAEFIAEAQAAVDDSNRRAFPELNDYEVLS